MKKTHAVIDKTEHSERVFIGTLSECEDFMEDHIFGYAMITLSEKESLFYTNQITEQDLRDAFNAGILKGKHIQAGNYYDAPLDETEYIDQFLKRNEEQPEKTIPVALGFIKETCGWSEFCDVTNSNHYMLKEHNVDDSEIFNVKISDAKKLRLI